MSTNNQLFKYWNKMALKHNLYFYAWHFSGKNMFGYSCVDFWVTNYIWIFVYKLLKILIYKNICPENYLIITGLYLMIKVNLGLLYVINKYLLLFRWRHEWAFSKVTTISDEYECSNVWIKWPSNNSCIHICAISRVKIYSVVSFVYH